MSDWEVAGRAAAWLRRFYPDVTVLLDRELVQLSSETHSEAGLRLIWASLLANEQLLARGAAARADVIDALVR